MPDSQRRIERLWPGPAVWLLGGSLVLAVSLAYARALGSPAGWVTACLGALGLMGGLARMAVPVRVDEAGLHAGRAMLPWSAMGRVLALGPQPARQARGPNGDPTAWRVLPPGVGPGAVVIEVVDDLDPHRTWLIASRDAEAMSRTINAARGTLTP